MDVNLLFSHLIKHAKKKLRKGKPKSQGAKLSTMDLGCKKERNLLKAKSWDRTTVLFTSN